MCIVSWGWDGYTSSTPHVGVAQLVRQHLQLVSVKMVVIPEDVVM